MVWNHYAQLHFIKQATCTSSICQHGENLGHRLESLPLVHFFEQLEGVKKGRNLPLSQQVSILKQYGTASRTKPRNRASAMVERIKRLGKPASLNSTSGVTPPFQRLPWSSTCNCTMGHSVHPSLQLNMVACAQIYCRSAAVSLRCHGRRASFGFWSSGRRGSERMERGGGAAMGRGRGPAAC